MVVVKSTMVPAVTQTLNLTSIRVLYGKVTFTNKFSSSLKIFIINRNKFQLGFENIVLKIINMCQDIVRHGKNTVQMIDFNSYVVLLLWVKLCYGILLRNVWRAGLQSCS